MIFRRGGLYKSLFNAIQDCVQLFPMKFFQRMKKANVIIASAIRYKPKAVNVCV